MKKFKRILTALLYPHPFLLALLFPLSVAMLLYAFLYEDAIDIMVYISYGLSAYALTVLCFCIPRIIVLIKRIKEHKAIKRLSDDPHLRVRISLSGSFLFNGGYAVMQLCLGVYYGFELYYAMAGYYFLISLMRIYLLRSTGFKHFGEDMLTEYKKYRNCGIYMLLLTVALSVAVTYTVVLGELADNGMIVTIAMASFTFTSFTVAAVNAVKYRKYKSPVFSAAKNSGLVTAAMSMLTLETSMLGAFGKDGSDTDKLVLLSLTGFGVTVFVCSLAVYMTVKGSRKVKKYRIEVENERKQ